MQSDCEPLGYRSSFDGLRTVAVIGVLLVHLHPNPLRSGGLGVDVFFALSGFLITTLILEELGRSNGMYRFGAFYVRRALRLFPAIYAALLVMGVYIFVRWDHLPEFLRSSGLRPPAGREVFLKYFLSAATYTGTFTGVEIAPGNFFSHTWSLAVEEQFYLIWPVILVVAFRRDRLQLLTRLVAAAILGLLAVRVFVPSLAWDYMWWRLDAIAAGSAFALLRWDSGWFRQRLRAHSSTVATVASACLVAMVLLTVSKIPMGLFIRGGYTVFGLIAALLVSALATKSSNDRRRPILENPLAVQIGLLSYSLYVWHLPAYTVIEWEFPNLPVWLRWSAQLLASVALALTSFHVIEQPFRRLQTRFRSVERSAGEQAAGLTAEQDGLL